MIDLGIDYHPGNYLPDHPAGNMRRRCIDNGDGTATETIWDPTGVVLSEATVPYQSPSSDVSPVLAAVRTARQEVAGLSPTGATRQAVEALCAAVESLATS